MEEQILRVTLPGRLYQRGDRWWWSVMLPGEDKTRSRPLKMKGAKAAVSDLEAAEKIAFEMWEQAVREQAQRQITAESSQKIAALKAQFLDKVREFTQVVENATAKAEAEARARAEAEEKLLRIAQTPPQKTEDGEPGTIETGPRACPNESGQPRDGVPKREKTAFGVPVAPADPQTARRNYVTPDSDPGPHSQETGDCECCGTGPVPVTQLKRIDSGQLLCSRCLAALRADAARTRPQPAARHLP